MSTTEAGRPTASQPDGSDVLAFQAVIDAARRLDELSCARVIGQIAEAVHAAQKAGQPLGTLTPSAIVLTRDGGVRLAPGTAAARYTAPEKLRGGSGDRRSDVFSLGVVLWEALAHEPLFVGASDAAIQQAVLSGAIRPASEYNANVPAELDAICQRALAAEPANRYQSAKVMAAEIDAVLGDAGYPESNEPIATYVGRWLAAEANKPAPPSSKTSPLPAMQLGPAAPAPRASTGTLPPPGLTPRASTTGTQSPASATMSSPTGAASTAPGARPARTTQPPPAVTASAASGARPASSTQPPSASNAASGVRSARSTEPPPAASARPASSPQPPAASPTSITTFGPTHANQPPVFAAGENTVPSSVWTSQTGTSPSPFTATRPPAHAGHAGLAGFEAEPTVLTPTHPPVGDPSRAAWVEEKTEILGSGAAPAAPSASTARPLATTAFLGSNALAYPIATPTPEPNLGPGATHVGMAPGALVPPASVSRTAPVPPGSAPPSARGPNGELPSFAPPEMPAAVGAVARPASSAQDSRPGLPAPFRASHAHAGVGPGAGKPSIATAATAETPHLPAHAAHAPSSQLGPPPGMTVAPAAPSAVLRTADTEFEDERHSEPAQVIEKGRDVLAGWGWSTGASEVIAPEEDDPHDAARTGRKRLVVAVGAALAVALVVAVAAFAFRGSTKPAGQEPVATASSPTAPSPTAASPTAPPATAPSPTAPPSSDVTAADPPAAPGTGSPSAAPAVVPPGAPASPTPPATTNEPPRPAVAEVPPAADAAKAVAASPTKPVAELPAKPAEPPRLTKPAEPPRAAAAVPSTTKPAIKDPPPAKLAATRPPASTTKKPAVKKPATRKPADDRLARAQPIDPYGAPDKPRVDPAAAYKTGLQQYARGDTSGALATFRSSLASHPGFAPTWRGLGLVYEKQGNRSQARAAFKRYLQLSPGASDAEQIRGRLERLGS